MRKILLSISMILICSVGFSADSINAQGVLRDADGVPVSSGSYAMRFLLYPAAEDGALLWAEVHTGSDKVTVSRGLYTAELGALTPFPDEFFSANPDLWLEVGVDLDDNAIFESNEIFSPRVQLLASAYALHANNSAALEGHTASDFSPANHSHFGEMWSGNVSTSGLKVLNQASSDNSIALCGVGNAEVPSPPTLDETGVRGESLNGIGVAGLSSNDVGVRGISTYSSGVYGTSSEGDGVVGVSSGGSNADNGVYGETNSTSQDDAGVYGLSTNDASGVYGRNTGDGYGVGAYSASWHGLHSQTASTNNEDAAVYGYCATRASAVYGRNVGVGSNAGYGLRAHSSYYNALVAQSLSTQGNMNQALRAISEDGVGLYSINANSDYYNIFSWDSDLGTLGSGIGVHGASTFFNDVVFWGAKSGFVVDIALNDGKESLERGDVVVISGAGKPVVGDIPVINVRKAAAKADEAVVGVVYKLYNPCSDLSSEEVASGRVVGRFVDDATEIKSGQYLGIVTYGAFNGVKVADSGAVSPGSLLTTSGAAGKASVAAAVEIEGIKIYPQSAVFGKALGSADSKTGLVPVFVTIK